jgi:phosphopantothenate synthetase
LARSYLAGERTTEFAIEALLFAIIVAISAWPVLAAAGALADFLRQAPV